MSFGVFPSLGILNTFIFLRFFKLKSNQSKNSRHTANWSDRLCCVLAVSSSNAGLKKFPIDFSPFSNVITIITQLLHNRGMVINPTILKLEKKENTKKYWNEQKNPSKLTPTHLYIIDFNHTVLLNVLILWLRIYCTSGFTLVFHHMSL